MACTRKYTQYGFGLCDTVEDQTFIIKFRRLIQNHEDKVMSVGVVIFEAPAIRHHCIFDGYYVSRYSALDGVFMRAQQYLALQVTEVT